MGALFYRGVRPSEIKEMPLHELKYWYEWHILLVETEKKAMETKK